MRAILKGLALGTALFAGATGVAGAQQQQQMPDVFMANEIALSPPEAAKQVEMMASTLAALPPQRPGVVDTYVLSVSFWNDPVFESEAKEAAGILARRYDAGDRTIVLSAGRGPGVARNYPVATPDNFQAALGKIGSIIDPNEDLVVVFMTSHGGPDGTVALQEKGRLAGGIRANHLRNSLAQAGIRSKVVIVSACFSGNFILPFSDPDTIVLTAAAADRTSFGCQPTRDWTYFGDALFNHTLRGGAPLVDAYDEAVKLISGWEGDLHANWEALPPSQKGKEPEPLPSNPQKNVGDNVLPLVGKAEAYGVAISCAGQLSFALDRARSGRPLKGMADMSQLQTAKTAAETRAQQEGARRQRSTQDTAKSIAATSASVLQLFSAQAADVSTRAVKCLAPGS